MTLSPEEREPLRALADRVQPEEARMAFMFLLDALDASERGWNGEAHAAEAMLAAYTQRGANLDRALDHIAELEKTATLYKESYEAMAAQLDVTERERDEAIETIRDIEDLLNRYIQKSLSTEINED